MDTFYHNAAQPPEAITMCQCRAVSLAVGPCLCVVVWPGSGKGVYRSLSAARVPWGKAFSWEWWVGTVNGSRNVKCENCWDTGIAKNRAASIGWSVSLGICVRCPAVALIFIDSTLHSLANLANDSWSYWSGVSNLLPSRAGATGREKASPTFGVSWAINNGHVAIPNNMFLSLINFYGKLWCSWLWPLPTLDLCGVMWCRQQCSQVGFV